MENKTKKPATVRAKTFFNKRLWESDMSKLGGIKGMGVAFLRVLITTINGIMGKRILVQASALSFATLLAIGPILAIVVMIAGMFFTGKTELVYAKLMDVATFVMPAFNQMMQDSTTTTEAVNGATAVINPEIASFIDNISKTSAKAGVIGILAMLVTCLLLCVNMETAMNYIWGIRKGRKWVDRIVFYFSMIFFGSVALIFGMTFFTTSQMPKILGSVPFVANYLSGFASWITYIMGISIMTALLAAYYKFIPIARVKWKPAFIGAILTMCLLILNNKGSFLYISYIAKQQSLYGYLAIVAVAMFSLYIFWTMILAGSQITYAIQYVDMLSDDEAWNNMGDRARKLCTLAVFAEIEKAFYSSKPHSPTIENLVASLKMPKNAIVASIEWLKAKDFICPVEFDETENDVYYKPAIDPDTITIGQFFTALSICDGDESTIEYISNNEPAVTFALEAYDAFAKSENGQKTLKQILS